MASISSSENDNIKKNTDRNKRFEEEPSVNWNRIESKWRERWERQKIFHSDPDSSMKKYFITVAFPYPNSPQHVGHGRTYTLADVHARYMRMKGYNVLFPMGFHYTGTPILAMSRRIASRDKELWTTFSKIYRVPYNEIASFVDPVKIARYFHNEIRLGMKEMGFSIDWRREFTTIDKIYSKFISWQFRTFQKKGLVIQGSHLVGWCPNDQNPVSQHDTIGDIEPALDEFTLIKFRLPDGNIVPTATSRPETVYGVTNLWINPKVKYVKIYLNNKDERWIVSSEGAAKLENLGHKLTIESQVNGKEMIGKLAQNPITSTTIPLYPGFFVEPEDGTGLVMSVPAHAPYDYQALEDLKNNASLQAEFGITLNGVTPIRVIKSGDDSGAEVVPAKEVTSKFNIKDQTDPRLIDATNELYSKEFYKGTMLQNAGKYSGMPVTKAKELIKGEILKSGHGDKLFEFNNKPVVCRCGTTCVVRLLNDQWFLNYGDPQWKYLAHECLDSMEILPIEIRQEFNHVIDWLRERACSRKSGLGTRLPWDEGWVIESLSDSVIYMAYYLLAKYANNNSIPDANNLNDSMFDYVILGKGDVDIVASECGVTVELLEELRMEFSYFYPVDSRHSGRDLVSNHLSFFIFGHVAIFKREYWPKQIVVNGSVMMEGKKMSKSLRNIIPLRTAIKEHGADAIRVALLGSAELLQDADFSFDSVKGIRSKLQDIYDTTMKSSQYSMSRLRRNEAETDELEDRWLLSRLQRSIAGATVSMDNLRVREAVHIVIYLLDQDLRWYAKRVSAKKREASSTSYALWTFLTTRIRMLAPIAPFISEEVWEKINDAPRSIIFAGWPVVEEDKKDIIAEESEQLIMGLVLDLHKIVRLTGINPRRISFYVAARWKSKIYNKILASVILESNTNFGDIMKQLIRDPQTSKAGSYSNLVRKMLEDILSEPIETRDRRLRLLDDNFDEKYSIEDARGLLSLESGNDQIEILVYSEDDKDLSRYDPQSKARLARPFKPAIYISDK